MAAHDIGKLFVPACVETAHLDEPPQPGHDQRRVGLAGGDERRLAANVDSYIPGLELRATAGCHHFRLGDLDQTEHIDVERSRPVLGPDGNRELDVVDAEPTMRAGLGGAVDWRTHQLVL